MRALNPSNKSITQRMGLILPIALSLFFILSLPMAFADYPVISTEEGINHNEAVKLVYSIPEKHYNFVKKIEFVNGFVKKQVIGNYGELKVWNGWAWTYWDKNHNCYGGKIILSKIDKNLLQHELGHIYEFCVLKRDYSTEEFANNFMIR